MARQYAPRAVLRHIPLDLLRQFLLRQDIPTGPDWASLTEGDHKAIYQAWLDLPTGPREQVEQMFRHVHEMATPAGVRAMIDEAFHRGHDITELIDPFPGHHAKALWVLLNHPLAFHTARSLLAVASPFGRYWNLTTGFGGIPADSTQAALQDLKLGIARLYREQGRGQRCTIEDYDRHGCLYLFVYLDDYTQTYTGHDLRGNLTRHAQRPTFEVVFVYNAEAGTLDLFAQGEKRWRTALLDLFCEHILHTSAPSMQTDPRPYKLNGLIDRDFPLKIDPAGGILRASIRKMRVMEKGSLERVTLEPNPAGARGVYDMLDRHFPIEQFPRCNLFVNQVTFNVMFRLPDDERDRSLTFDVSFPDACNLKSMPDERRAIGERCLRIWGILNDTPPDGPSQTRRVA